MFLPQRTPRRKEEKGWSLLSTHVESATATSVIFGGARFCGGRELAESWLKNYPACFSCIVTSFAEAMARHERL